MENKNADDGTPAKKQQDRLEQKLEANRLRMAQLNQNREQKTALLAKLNNEIEELKLQVTSTKRLGNT